MVSHLGDGKRGKGERREEEEERERERLRHLPGGTVHWVLSPKCFRVISGEVLGEDINRTVSSFPGVSFRVMVSTD